MTQNLYHDPDAGHSRPELIVDLLDVPARESNHQLENQATMVLAWLIDRSPELGRAVLELLIGEPPPAGKIGARTQLSLTKPGGGAVYPDLSICVAGRELQVLVEVKVGSEFHQIEAVGRLLQPDAYRQLWGPPGPLSPTRRAVGTLTRAGGDSPPDPDALVARDVAWAEVRNVIAEAIEASAVAPEVRLVAGSFLTAIDTRIAPPKASPEATEAFFAEWRPALGQMRAAFDQHPGTHGSKPIRGEEYEGFRVDLGEVDGVTVFFRAYLALAGSRLNLHGAPSSLVLAPEHNTDGELSEAHAIAAEAAGFSRTKDIAGYWLHRQLFPLEAPGEAGLTEATISAMDEFVAATAAGDSA